MRDLSASHIVPHQTRNLQLCSSSPGCCSGRCHGMVDGGRTTLVQRSGSRDFPRRRHSVVLMSAPRWHKTLPIPPSTCHFQSSSFETRPYSGSNGVLHVNFVCTRFVKVLLIIDWLHMLTVHNVSNSFATLDMYPCIKIGILAVKRSLLNYHVIVVPGTWFHEYSVLLKHLGN